MKKTLGSPRFLLIAVAFLALIIVPLTIIQVQNQQNIRQNASTTSALWATSQSATTSCPAIGTGAEIEVTFTNTEPTKASLSMNVVATDQQTGKSVNMGSIVGGNTKTDSIKTGKATLNAGSVKFALKWTDGHSGTDSRSASYKAVGNCTQPTATPIPLPSPSPTSSPTQTPTPLPSGAPTPTPTICPTLAPVKNVHIDCPNCK